MRKGEHQVLYENLKFDGLVEAVLVANDRDSMLSTRSEEIYLGFEGFEGDKLQVIQEKPG